jgi:hypothetical protein
MNSDKKSPLNFWVIIGFVLIVQSLRLQVEGAATGSLKVFGIMGGVGCCAVGVVKGLKATD